MSKLSTDDYTAIAQSAIDKGVTPEEFGEAVRNAGMKLKYDGKTHHKFYYSRVMAIMHNLGESGGEIPEF